MQTRQFWNSYSNDYDALTHFEDYNKYLDHLIDILDIQPGERVLDAGCGTGNLTRRLLDRGAKVVALDFSNVALDLCRQKAPEAIIMQHSLEDSLPFKKGDFDKIVCASVLIALSENGRQQALREFHRVLNLNGALLVSVMKPGHSRWEMFFSYLRKIWHSCSWHEMRHIGSMVKLVWHNAQLKKLGNDGYYHHLSNENLSKDFAYAQYGKVAPHTSFGERFSVFLAHPHYSTREVP